MHFVRNVLAHAGRQGRRGVLFFVATAFARDDAEPDVLADVAFPQAHRAKLHSTNPIERLNGEIKRRADVAGIFPNEAAILLEQNDERAVQRARCMSLETIAPIRDNPVVALSAVTA